MRTLHLAALSLFLTGCGAQAEAEEAPTQATTGNRVTLGPLPAPPLNAGDGWHTDFRKAFTHGTVIDRPEESIHIEVLDIGRLQVEDEAMLAIGDPLAAHTAIPLPVRGPPGAYLVQVSKVLIRAKDRTGQAERIACARIRLGEGRAESWRFAGSFGAEDGICAFMTDRACEILGRGGRAGARHRIAMAASRDGFTHATASSTPEGDGPPDVAWCHTGFGGNTYDIYVGLDAQGAPVEVVADFEILLEPVETQAIVEDPINEPPRILPLQILEDLGMTVRRAHPDERVPISDQPLWFEVDARENRRDPRLGFPEIRGEDADGRPVPIVTGNEGFKIWVTLPAEGQPVPDRLVFAVRTGFKTL